MLCLSVREWKVFIARVPRNHFCVGFVCFWGIRCMCREPKSIGGMRSLQPRSKVFFRHLEPQYCSTSYQWGGCKLHFFAFFLHFLPFPKVAFFHFCISALRRQGKFCPEDLAIFKPFLDRKK